MFGGEVGNVANIILRTSNVGLANMNCGNAVATQTLNILGSAAATVTIEENETANSIAAKINDKSSSTNVKAEASTTLTLSNLLVDGAASLGGAVSFGLKGMNTTAVPISASVTTADLTSLKTEINKFSGVTGIRAEFDNAAGTTALVLSEPTGKDIKIADFSVVGAQAYQDPATTPVVGTGSTVPYAKTASIDVKGNVQTNSMAEHGDSIFFGRTVTLSAGGTATNAGHNSTVIGGHIEFTSPDNFCLASSINGAANPGSLFNVAASADIHSVTTESPRSLQPAAFTAAASAYPTSKPRR